MTLQAYGGYNASNARGTGGAGTVYKESAAQSGTGDLIVDNASYDSWDDSYMGRTTLNATFAFDSITIQNAGNLETGSSSSITYNTLNWSTTGIITDNGGTFAVVSGGGSLTIPATSRLVGNTARTFTGVTVTGTLTHTSNTTVAATNYKLDYTVNGDLEISSGGAVNADYKGYMSGNGPGTPAAQGSNNGGGGYGGIGGNGSSYSGGPTYGSSTEPTDLGSGGGDYNTETYLAGAGGGAVKLTVSGAMTIPTGTSVSANGQNYPQTTFSPGGGSGGSVWIATGTLAGSGKVTANGGNGYGNGAGGGGGRIAITYTTNNAMLKSISVSGGSGYNNGSVGTIYPDPNPTISTQAASDITESTATGNGSVDALSLFGVSQHGHVWSQSSSPTLTYPTAQYKMNDNAANTTVTDSMGFHDGTAQQNTSALTTAGKINTALDFNGTTDYVSIPDDPNLNFGANQDFSINVWVKTTQVAASNVWPVIVSKEDRISTRNGYNINLHNGTTDSRWHLNIYVAGTIYRAYGSSDIADGEWHMLTAIRSGSTLYTYQDGVYANQAAASSANVTKAIPLNIGRSPGGTSDSYFSGQIDEVRIYRKALSQNEIGMLYNGSNGTEGTYAATPNSSQLGSKSSTGVFDSTLTGLTPSTTYYVRSYAQCSDGVVTYGDVEQFETLSGDPVSTVTSPADGKYKLNVTTISGTANPVVGTITAVQISIKDATDGSHWWDGDGWDATEETWLNTDNAISWSYNSSAVAWEIPKQYTIRSKATNSEGYTETPGSGITFTYSDAPPKFNLKGIFQLEGNATFR